MVVASFSETMVSYHIIKQYHNPEDHNFLSYILFILQMQDMNSEY
jgi:hypothetical protein